MNVRKETSQMRQNIINRIGAIETHSGFGPLERNAIRKELQAKLDKIKVK